MILLSRCGAVRAAVRQGHRRLEVDRRPSTLLGAARVQPDLRHRGCARDQLALGIGRRRLHRVCEPQDRCGELYCAHAMPMLVLVLVLLLMLMLMLLVVLLVLLLLLLLLLLLILTAATLATF